MLSTCWRVLPSLLPLSFGDLPSLVSVLLIPPFSYSVQPAETVKTSTPKALNTLRRSLTLLKDPYALKFCITLHLFCRKVVDLSERAATALDSGSSFLGRLATWKKNKADYFFLRGSKGSQTSGVFLGLCRASLRVSHWVLHGV